MLVEYIDELVLRVALGLNFAENGVQQRRLYFQRRGLRTRQAQIVQYITFGDVGRLIGFVFHLISLESPSQ